MINILLNGCPIQPLGSYLKALGILRLLSEQLSGKSVRGKWGSEYFLLDSDLDQTQLTNFFLHEYRPSSILAPWNGGSGFYIKDRKIGISSIMNSSDPRFALYRADLELAAGIVAAVGVEKGGNKREEDVRREIILRNCRNQLSDVCVDWLDAAIAISADGSRSFAPILGTGGNEGRLDYTNNFMENVFGLLSAKAADPARSLLNNALFGTQTAGFQDLAIGQYDPGRSGGFNQGTGIESKALVNPWNAVLMLEGAIAWAGGIYRKQGITFRSVLCSPFTVRPSALGFGSASKEDEATARAEIWTPLWDRSALYSEIRSLMREGRASVGGRASGNGLQFAEAAASLGVDRAISGFVRYSMLKRRGDSYIAMPAGQFPVKYRSTSDNVREAETFCDRARRVAFVQGLDSTNAWPPLEREIGEAMFQALQQTDEARSLLRLAAALGEMNLWLLSHEVALRGEVLQSSSWVLECEAACPEGRIAAAIASTVTDTLSASDLLKQTLAKKDGRSFWVGRDLSERMLSTLARRAQAEQVQASQIYVQRRSVDLADVSMFLGGKLNEDLIQSLLGAFALVRIPPSNRSRGVIDAGENCRQYPAYCLLKQLFSTTDPRNEEFPKLRPDVSALSFLRAGRLGDASAIAIRRLQIAGITPLISRVSDGLGARRIGAALLIPISSSDIRQLRKFISKTETEE